MAASGLDLCTRCKRVDPHDREIGMDAPIEEIELDCRHAHISENRIFPKVAFLPIVLFHTPRQSCSTSENGPRAHFARRGGHALTKTEADFFNRIALEFFTELTP